MASRKNKQVSGTVWFIGMIVLFMLVIIGVVLYAPKENYDYNAFHITKDECEGTNVACYYAELSIREQAYTISFYNHPSDVDNISVSANALAAVLAMQKVANHTVYIAVPQGAPGQLGVAGVALARVLGSRYGIMNLNVKGAEYGSDQGQVDCSDVSPRVVVIAMRQGAENSVTVPSPHCVVMTAQSADEIIGVSEAFTYRLFGIIPTYVRKEATNSTA